MDQEQSNKKDRMAAVLNLKIYVIFCEKRVDKYDKKSYYNVRLNRKVFFLATINPDYQLEVNQL